MVAAAPAASLGARDRPAPSPRLASTGSIGKRQRTSAAAPDQIQSESFDEVRSKLLSIGNFVAILRGVVHGLGFGFLAYQGMLRSGLGRD